MKRKSRFLTVALISAVGFGAEFPSPSKPRIDADDGLWNGPDGQDGSGQHGNDGPWDARDDGTGRTKDFVRLWWDASPT